MKSILFIAVFVLFIYIGNYLTTGVVANSCQALWHISDIRLWKQKLLRIHEESFMCLIIELRGLETTGVNFSSHSQTFLAMILSCSGIHLFSIGYYNN